MRHRRIGIDILEVGLNTSRESAVDHRYGSEDDEYVDLNDDQPYIHEFSNKGITRITVNELKNNNYISDLSDPLAGGDIPLSYTVVIYLTDDKHIDTCIIESEYETDATGNAIETKHCVANSKGEFENVVCCNNKY